MKKLPSKLPKELTDRFQVVDNTLKRAVKQNPKDRIELEIGDSKQPDFLPQAKIMRWDNETNFSLRYVDNEPGEPVIETQGKVIKYVKPKVEFHAYELDPSELGEDGGLEIELLLKEKPDTNKFDFTIQTKELDFFYQPALTQEEIDEGGSRPENVSGSYAVYHQTKGGMNRSDGMEYKAGKAFHIYRPKVTDANGQETWGELSIDEQAGLLSVTIDQAWLDTAVYPVLVDPTFGYTSIGGTKTSTIDGLWKATRITTPSEYGSFTKLTMYGGWDATHTVQEQIKGLITTDTGLTIVTNGAGNAVNMPGPQDSYSWIDATYTTPATLAASTNYAIGILFNVSNERIFHDVVTDAAYQDTSNSFSSPTNPTDSTLQARKYSVYATYTATVSTSIKDMIGGGFILFPR